MSQEQQEKPIARYLPITVELQVPKEMDKQRVSEITLRPPTTNDVILSQKSAANEADQDVLLFANLSDTTEDLIRSLEFYDYKRVEKAFNCFLLPIAEHCARRASLFPQAEAGSTGLPTCPSTN